MDSFHYFLADGTMMKRCYLFVVSTAIIALTTCNGFTNTNSMLFGVRVHARYSSKLAMRVTDIDCPTAFDNTIKTAGTSLVVVDYSARHCGPCRMISPKFDEFSEKYPDAIFLKVRTDCVVISFYS
mmetsp:Transcript_13119/g.30555  ORF Transcript_13119/g.30555 Transcript_13119/m.30555 type:complete len:126 (+) Transcript_13119:2-379(+)